MNNQDAHPTGLYVLFFTELWERFSFYGMRALLVLYLTKELLFSDDKAYGIYGAYGALVYTTPVIGGLLADRLLGYQRAIVMGATLMALGHFALAVPNRLFFYGALALLITGNGLFKPNISSLVGQLYRHNDPRRDAGFTVFYMGINVGAFAAPLACGFIGQSYGWHYGFGLAGIGMLIGLCTFLAQRRRFTELGLGLTPVSRPSPTPSRRWLSARNAAYAGIVLSLPVLALLVVNNRITGGVLIAMGVTVLGGLLYLAMRQERILRDRILVIVILIFFHMTFWAFFEQAGSSINLFTDRNVDRSLFGWTIPASMFQAVNPMFIILFAPLFSALWPRLASKNREPSTPAKFALGIVQLAAGFAALAAGAATVGADGKTSMLWLLLGYMLITTGELCLSPVGLSMVTRMAPAKLVGAMMGAWFLSVAFAQYLAALIATFTSAPDSPAAGASISLTQTASIYGEVFTQIAYVAVAAAVLLLAISPLLRRWMHETEHGDDRQARAENT